jgi:PAS domain S-box-containing protein
MSAIAISATTMSAIAMSATVSRPPMPLAVTPQEQAWLTFQAMDQSDDIVLLLDSDAGAATTDVVIIGANGAFRRASGFSEDQVRGRPVAELFPVGDDSATLMDAIHSHGPLRTELRCGRADGSTFMLGLHLMPAPARAQGRVCFALLGRDITEAFHTRQQQDSVQRLLAKVFISVDEAVAIIDGTGRIVMTNPHVDRLLGYAPNGLIGRGSLEVVAPECRAAVAETRKRQLEEGGDTSFRATLLRADGSRLGARITSVLVGSDDLKQFRILTLRAEAGDTTETRTETAGRIRLVGMDEVRAALGDRWPAMAARAMATAEAVMRRRCGSQDSYERIGDTGFLVCFGLLSEPEASFRAAVIGREIRERLIGQGSDTHEAHVHAIAAAVRFPDHHESGAELREVLLAGLEQQVAGVEEQARRTLQATLAGVTCVLERITGHNPDETVATLVRLPAGLERQLVCALSVLPRKETDVFDLDGLLLGLAAQQAVKAMARGDTGRLLVNIRFDVFGTRVATERYVALCMRIDKRVCKHLTLLLTALPEGLPRSRQLECVNRLRPFCAAVGFQVDEVAGLATIDVSQSVNPLVALPAAALAGIAPGRIKEVIGGLHARRAKVLVRRIASATDAATFLSLGADLISMEPAGV